MHGYDNNALAVGQAVLRETGAQDVILFGSRARGDYRKDSDIDLLLVHQSILYLDGDYDAVRDKFRRDAETKAQALYGMPVSVDLCWFTPDEFDRMRRSRNDVSAIAAEEGITMNGGPASEQYPNADYSDEWNTTTERLYHARTHLRGLSDGVQLGQPDLLVGQQAQQSLEHAIKALISASGHRYQRIHDLEELERDMRRAAPGFTYMLQSPLRLLSGYAGGEIYRRRPGPSLGNHTELRRQVETDVQQIVQRIATLTGKDPWLEQSDTPEA